MTSTRDRLVTATTELFRRRGYNGTALKDVIAAADATVGSLYHFFPGGKVDLSRAAITESGAAYQQLFEAIADEAGDVAAAIKAMFDGAAVVLEQSDFVDICPIGTVAREIASTDETLRLATDAVITGWIEALAGRLRAEGLRRRDATELAATIVATLEGMFVVVRVRRDATALRAAGRRMSALVAAEVAAEVAAAAGRAPGRAAPPAARARPRDRT